MGYIEDRKITRRSMNVATLAESETVSLTKFQRMIGKRKKEIKSKHPDVKDKDIDIMIDEICYEGGCSYFAICLEYDDFETEYEYKFRKRAEERKLEYEKNSFRKFAEEHSEEAISLLQELTENGN